MRTKPIALLAIAGAVLIGAASLLPQPTLARQPEVFTGIVRGVAVGGYDPVAYFTDGKPTIGKLEIALEHAGATYRFATSANREAFKAEPAKYIPQFGGYCAWAVSQGYTAKGDPNAWSLVNGRLYLNYDRNVRANWEKNKAVNIANGEANWPKVLAK